MELNSDYLRITSTSSLGFYVTNSLDTVIIIALPIPSEIKVPFNKIIEGIFSYEWVKYVAITLFRISTHFSNVSLI